MRNIIFIVLLLWLPITYAANLSSLEDTLFRHAPKGYYPKNGEYKLYDNLCNSKTCFIAVSIYYVSSSNKGMRRIAIFSKEGKYLGSYSGFSENPVSSIENVIKFPNSKYGDEIKFNGNTPPASVWIDGETFSFEKAL